MLRGIRVKCVPSVENLWKRPKREDLNDNCRFYRPFTNGAPLASGWIRFRSHRVRAIRCSKLWRCGRRFTKSWAIKCNIHHECYNSKNRLTCQELDNEPWIDSVAPGLERWICILKTDSLARNGSWIMNWLSYSGIGALQHIIFYMLYRLMSATYKKYPPPELSSKKYNIFHFND